MKRIARYKLKKAILLHETMRDIILHFDRYHMDSDMTINEMHRAECEDRCAKRLRKILNKYY